MLIPVAINNVKAVKELWEDVLVGMDLAYTGQNNLFLMTRVVLRFLLGHIPRHTVDVGNHRSNQTLYRLCFSCIYNNCNKVGFFCLGKIIITINENEHYNNCNNVMKYI